MISDGRSLAWCPRFASIVWTLTLSAGSGQALGLGLTRAEEHARLGQWREIDLLATA